MRILNPAFLLLFFALAANGDDQRNFTGAWKLNTARSDIRGSYLLPDGFLRVEQSAAGLKLAAGASEAGPLTEVFYPLGGNSQKSTVGEFTLNVVAKWEGDVLLVNTIVTGAKDFAESERWDRSRDGRRMTITRTIQRPDGEVESVLIFEKSGVQAPAQTSSILNAPAPSPAVGAPASAAADTSDSDFVVAAGTRILMTLTNAVNTKHSAVGDKVYLTTSVPVFVRGQLVIPQGSYVTGTITESTRAGRVKGKAALNLRFETLTLPTGVSRDFRSRAGSVDTAGNLDRKEGRIKGEGNTGGDIRTVAGTTAAGTGIGTLAGAAAGHVGMGAGVGAAAGALAGIGGVLATRGPDVTIPPGTTMELVLDRELRFSSLEILR